MMKCNNPRITIDNGLPVDFEGEHLNIQFDEFQGKVWVCIDGISVFRAKNIKSITIHEKPIPNDLLCFEDEEPIA
jgi:hypothetical protein